MSYQKIIPIILLFTGLTFIECATTQPSTTTQTAEKSEEPIEFVFPPYTGEQEKPEITVLTFTNNTPFESDALGEGVANTLITALVKTHHFIVIERNRLDQVIKEQNLGMAGLIDSQSASKVGQLLGIDYIVTGGITEFGIKKSGTAIGYGGEVDAGIGLEKGTARIVLDARVIDVESGGIIFAETGVGTHFSTNIGVAFEEISLMSGTTGFDGTLAGKATRKAVYDITKKLIKGNF